MIRSSTAGTAPLRDVVAALAQAYPDHEMQRLVFPKTDDGTYLAHLVNAGSEVRYASVDPGTAEILHTGGIWSFPMEAMVLVHFNLMAGVPGLFVICLLGALTVGLIATGVVVWWPMRFNRRSLFAIHWHRDLRFVIADLHRKVGGIVSPLLLVLVTAGALLAWEPFLSGANLSSVRWSGTEPRASTGLDRAFNRAVEEFPSHGIHDLRLPDPSTLYVLFRAEETGPRAVHVVEVSLPGGTVERVIRAGENPNLAYYLLPLHTGDQFGVPGRVTVFLSGIIILGMAITGLIMWLQNRKALAAKRAARVTAAG